MSYNIIFFLMLFTRIYLLLKYDDGSFHSPKEVGALSAAGGGLWGAAGLLCGCVDNVIHNRPSKILKRRSVGPQK